MIAVFGGMFNPIHLGHLILAETVLMETEVEKVLFLPAFQPAHKNIQRYPLLPAACRLDWVRRVIAGNPRFFCDDMEIQRRGVSYMADSLEEMKRAHPEWKLALLLGQDALSLFPSWKRVEDFPRLCSRIIVASRQTAGFFLKEEDLRGRKECLSWIKEISIYLPRMPLIDISSTMIRQRIKAGESIRYLVPEEIREEVIHEVSI